MSEWHVTPDYIMGHWSFELFDLMSEKIRKRKKKQADGMKTGKPQRRGRRRR